MPDLIEKANCMMNKCLQNKKDLGDKIINTVKKKCEEKASNQNEKCGDIKVETVKEEIKIEKNDEQE